MGLLARDEGTKTLHMEGDSGNISKWTPQRARYMDKASIKLGQSSAENVHYEVT